MTERDLTTRLRLRPVEAADEPFLFAIYAGTRSAEMELVDWNDEQKQMFLQQQFQAQQAHYQAYFPTGEHSIILVNGTPVGRWYLERSPEKIHLLDIALLEQWRRQGIGNTLMRDLLAEANAAHMPVTLHVYRFDTYVLEWYQRLGFSIVGGTQMYYLMEYRPTAEA